MAMKDLVPEAMRPAGAMWDASECVRREMNDGRKSTSFGSPCGAMRIPESACVNQLLMSPQKW